MKKNGKVLLLGFAAALALACPGAAIALNCQALEEHDKPAIKQMYHIYIVTGASPSPILLKYTPLKAPGSFRVQGTVKGPATFLDCMKDKPPCAPNSDVAEIPITYYSTNKEIAQVYAKSPAAALLECFRRLGVPLQDPPPKSFIPGF